MSTIFGFTQAAAVAGWLAFLLVRISHHRTSDASVWYDSKRDQLQLWWAPRIWVFDVFWAFMYAILTVAIFYFTQVVTPDTWQYITGFTMIVTHILMLKVWDYIFWGYGMASGGLLVFLGLYGTGAVILVCCIVGQSGLYLVPTLLFSAYILLLMFPMILNWVIAYPTYSLRKHHHNHRKSDRYDAIRVALLPDEARKQ